MNRLNDSKTVTTIDDLLVKIKKEVGDGESRNYYTLITSNPPYQASIRESRVGYQNIANMPIYPDLIDVARVLANRSIVICPGRWLFGAGSQSKEWTSSMLNDKSVSIPFYKIDSAKVFPNTDIKGGVSVVDIIKGRVTAGLNGNFILFNELRSILDKVKKLDQKSLSSIIFRGGSYGYVISKQGIEVKSILETNVFSKNPSGIFSEDKLSENHVKILGLLNNKRTYRWIDKSILTYPDNFEKWKVILPAASGKGILGEGLSTNVIGKPLIGSPLIGTTQTFLNIGSFDNELEAEACFKYIKTRFARALLGIKKTTQHNNKKTWEYVPLQDFSANSDIDWSKTVREIDEQLYKKYRLDDTEVCFIEENIREMI